MQPTIPDNAFFECQGCGLVIDHYPDDDCPDCGGGHWRHPPTFAVHLLKGNDDVQQ